MIFNKKKSCNNKPFSLPTSHIPGYISLHTKQQAVFRSKCFVNFCATTFTFKNPLITPPPTGVWRSFFFTRAHKVTKFTKPTGNDVVSFQWKQKECDIVNRPHRIESFDSFTHTHTHSLQAVRERRRGSRVSMR